MFHLAESNTDSFQSMLLRIRRDQRKREQRLSEFYGFDFASGAPKTGSSRCKKTQRFEWEATNSDQSSNFPKEDRREVLKTRENNNGKKDDEIQDE